MDKEKIFDIVQDLELLNKYSEFIPESYRHTYNQILDKARSDLKNIISDNTNIKENFKQNNISVFIEKNYTKIFDKVLDSISAKINDEEKSLGLLLKESEKETLDFFEYFETLEKNKKVSFSKIENDIPNRGWIKIGEILINSGLITLDNLKTAIEYQSSKPDLFLGESLIELKLLDNANLRKALKAQRWLSKICE